MGRDELRLKPNINQEIVRQRVAVLQGKESGR
jgi:hypothetical protein